MSAARAPTGWRDAAGRRTRPAPAVQRVAERAARDRGRRWPAERELTALWLLGRAPAEALPWPLLRAGRAGRGAGPDVREALFLAPGGVPSAGAVEVHVRASDFVRHGHHRDRAYDGVLLHLVWEDDLDAPVRLAGGGRPPTAAVGPALRWRPEALRALLRRGPCPQREAPCAAAARTRPPRETVALVRVQGRRRLAERVWRAARLVEREGPAGAWARLLERALHASAGRRRRSPPAEVGAAQRANGGAEPWRALMQLARGRRPGALIEALRADGTLAAGGLGAGRAGEVGWNAALPLLAALAAAHDDIELARGTAALADAWPAPRPYGRTRALEAQLLAGRPRPRGAGALWAQGLLHLQELWCERGGCGACPLSCDDPQPEPGLDHGRPA